MQTIDQVALETTCSVNIVEYLQAFDRYAKLVALLAVKIFLITQGAIGTAIII